MHRSFLNLALLAAGSFISASTSYARAQWMDNLESDFSVTSSYRRFYQSDVNADSGEIAVAESKVEFQEELKIYQLPLTFGAVVKHVDINDTIVQELPTALIGRMFETGAKFPAPFMDHEHFFMGVDIRPSLYTDEWGETWGGGAFRIPFRTYLIYKGSDDFILVGGVYVRPEFDTEVLPVIGFIYRPNERLSFNFASDDPHVAYKLTDQATLMMEFGYTLDEYEVKRGTQDGVVLRYSGLTTGAGIKYDFNDCLQAAVSAGGAFARRLEYDDGAGKVVPENAVYSSVRLTARF